MIEIQDYIYLPARKLVRRQSEAERPIIRISNEAYNTLMEITEQTNLSLSKVASEIITQSIDLIKFTRKED